MIGLRWAAYAVSIVFCVVWVSGCGGAREEVQQAAHQQQTYNDFKVLYFAYMNYVDSYAKAPAGWDELIEYASKTGGDADSLRRMRDAGYQVQWGVKIGDTKLGSAEIVLAQPSSGELKLMLDGSVRQ